MKLPQNIENYSFYSDFQLLETSRYYKGRFKKKPKNPTKSKLLCFKELEMWKETGKCCSDYILLPYSVFTKGPWFSVWYLFFKHIMEFLSRLGWSHQADQRHDEIPIYKKKWLSLVYWEKKMPWMIHHCQHFLSLFIPFCFLWKPFRLSKSINHWLFYCLKMLGQHNTFKVF